MSYSTVFALPTAHLHENSVGALFGIQGVRPEPERREEILCLEAANSQADSISILEYCFLEVAGNDLHRTGSFVSAHLGKESERGQIDSHSLEQSEPIEPVDCRSTGR